MEGTVDTDADAAVEVDDANRFMEAAKRSSCALLLLPLLLPVTDACDIARAARAGLA